MYVWFAYVEVIFLATRLLCQLIYLSEVVLWLAPTKTTATFPNNVCIIEYNIHYFGGQPHARYRVRAYLRSASQGERKIVEEIYSRWLLWGFKRCGKLDQSRTP